MLLLLANLLLQPPSIPACTAEAKVCQVALPTPRELRAMIGKRPQAWRVRGDVLTVVARRPQPASLCCALQTPLHPIGGGLQAVALRVPGIDSAIVDIKILVGEKWPDDEEIYRGPRAESAPVSLPLVQGRLSYHEIASRHLGEHRNVQVYMPPGVPKGVRLPALYLGDGLMPELAGVAEALWQSGEVAPFVLIGIESSRKRGEIGCAPRCDGRSREYLIDIPDLPADQSRFDAHARFVKEELIPLMEASFPLSRQPQDRLTGGYSSGGAWALTMAVRHRDMIGGAIAMSVGWLPAAEEAAKLDRGNLFIGGGRLEGRFYERSMLAAENARRAGANVRLLTPNAGHSFENWTILFADALRWHFPAKR